MKPWWLLVNSMFPSDGNKAVFSISPQTLNQMLIPLSCVVLFSTRPKAEEHSPSSPSALSLPLLSLSLSLSSIRFVHENPTRGGFAYMVK